MVVEPADQDIVAWANGRSSPWYYIAERGLPQPCLKVQCGHVTAFFHRGRLTRLWAHADGPLLDDMFAELTQVFGLCANGRSAPGTSALYAANRNALPGARRSPYK